MSNTTLKKVSEALTEESIELTFDIRPMNWRHEFLQSLGLKKWPKQKSYILRPITLGTLIKISKLLIDIDMSIFDAKNLLEGNYQAIVKHGEAVCEIVAMAIHGRPGKTPADMVEMVLNNFTTKELQGAMSLILGQMDIVNFMSSIISMKGTLQILEPPTEMSQSMQEELIASGVLSAAS